MSDDAFRYDATIAKNKRELMAALERFVERTGVAPKPEDEDAVPEALRYTGKLFGGLRADLRRRVPHYVSDFRDGLTVKSIGPVMFLFFACLAPTVTFGGIMADKTGDQLGVVEMILATSICGVVYALFAGQPLIILGGTGPLLIFTAILYQLSEDLGVAFLPVFSWVGIWSSLLVILLAITDASFMMRYFTRFTNEIFAALISAIFIYESVRAIWHYFIDDIVSHDTALLTLILALGTFYIATNLSRMKRSRYLAPKAREFLADFGPMIAIAVMTIVSIRFHAVDIDELAVPETFGTTSGRAWGVALFDAPTWVRFAAIGPAMLMAVLMYLDQNITSRIINSPDNKLEKGAAYHQDLLVVGLLMGVCSLLCIPWVVAATVRSLNHLRSLASTEDILKNDGTAQQRIMHVRENRVTGFAIHLLIGLSLLALPLLRYIPMAVLYGLFLYMGVVSMAGNSFFERLNLWPMDSSLYPTTHYTRRVPLKSIHLFTGIQLVCLVLLWIVKASVVGILFPLFIAMLVPVRLLMSRWFTPVSLEALDAEEIPADEADRFQ